MKLEYVSTTIAHRHAWNHSAAEKPRRTNLAPNMIVATASPSIEAAQKWATMDPNPITAKHTLDLVSKASGDSGASSSALESLESLFPPEERIGFGTAGLRAEMKPGPLGMNDLTVCQAAQGLASYCLKKQQSTPSERITAIVGYDHRSHPTLNISSLSFALLTAIIFAEAGIDCLLLHNFVMTPLVPFGIQKFDAVCGVMVTASHNPHQDNGYKVYDSDACQIRSPTDKAIATEIFNNLEPWRDYRSILEKRRKEYPDDPCLGLSNPKATQELLEEYFESLETSGLRTPRSQVENRRPPSFSYTAMHGIGHPFAKRAFESCGLGPIFAVPEQRDPDPSFPTVPFPNPEETGALDLAMAFSETQNCDIVLANDPDADRLAVAERDRTTGIWTVFSGDQIGTMLGLWIWERLGKNSNKPVSMCHSMVSSKMLAEIGRVEGFYVEETLTGFKWIGSRSAELKAEGYYHVFGYEEAIGFACGDVIFDKDGISAMVVLAELAIHLYQKEGISLKKHMDSLYEKYGYFCSRNGYYKVVDANKAKGLCDRLQAKLTVDDQQIRSISNNKLLKIHLHNGCCIQLRPSGTEPKFKYYLEMQGKPGQARETLQHELEYCEKMLLDEILEPAKNGLTR